MITSTTKGDLVLNAQQGIYKAIVQGCNIYHTMGAGLAPQIAKAWPDSKVVDSETNYGDFTRLGTVSEHLDIDRNCRIINMYTQDGYGRVPVVYADYNAIATGFKLLNDTQSEQFKRDTRKVGIPMIGAGLANGHWQAIKVIIDLVTPDLPLELVVYQPQSR